MTFRYIVLRMIPSLDMEIVIGATDNLDEAVRVLLAYEGTRLVDLADVRGAP